MSSSDERARGGFMQRPLSVRVKKILTVLLAAATLALIALSLARILQKTEVTERFPAHFVRVTEAGEEEYEDETVCPVEYETEDGAYTCVVNYTFEEWEALPTGHEIDGFVYRLSDGRALGFGHEASETEIRAAVRDLNTDANRSTLSIALALGLMAVSFLLMVLWGHFFTDYEQIWFLSIMVLAGVSSILVPEEDVNGVKGVYIMGMYLLDTFLNILCELLIAKQSKWNFIVSVFVEITEIVICIVLAYRFATLATTLFFWLPIDIVSFINWHRHPDRQEEELTKVRKLSGKTRALILAAIAVWTVVVGYFLSGLSIRTDLFGGNATVETLVAYLDACVSAVAVVNGVLIFLRYQEQWIAWMVDAVLEGVINILSGQYVLLVLKAGYITNSTYGYVKWRKYIGTHEKEEQNLLSL